MLKGRIQREKMDLFLFVLIGLFVISGCSGVDENEKREKLKTQKCH